MHLPPETNQTGDQKGNQERPCSAHRERDFRKRGVDWGGGVLIRPARKRLSKGVGTVLNARAAI